MPSWPARSAYNRIVDDFKAVVREYHAEPPFNNDLFDTHKRAMQRRLNERELPFPVVQVDAMNGEVNVLVYLQDEDDQHLDEAYAEAP